MRLALDTNRYVDLSAGLEDVVERVVTAEAVFIPFVVMAELRAGFLGGSRAHENERRLTQFLAQPGVAVLYPDDQTTQHYARLVRQLRTQGTPIPTNDIWIAALVTQHSLALYARDAHFDRLPQINRV